MSAVEIDEEIAKLNLLGKSEVEVTTEMSKLGFSILVPRQKSELKFRRSITSDIEELGIQDHMEFLLRSRHSFMVERTVELICIFEEDILKDVITCQSYNGP